MKKQITILLFLLWNSLVSIGQESKEYLLFKVQYKNLPTPEEQPIGYVAIEFDKLAQDIVLDDTLNLKPKLLYLLTKLGGIYLWENSSKEESLACCSHGIVSKAYSLNEENHVSLNTTDIFDGTLTEILSRRKGTLKVYKTANQEYVIKYWKIKMQYCVCPLFMNTPTYPIFRNEGGYILDVSLGNRINRKDRVSINNSLKALLQM